MNTATINKGHRNFAYHGQIFQNKDDSASGKPCWISCRAEFRLHSQVTKIQKNRLIKGTLYWIVNVITKSNSGSNWPMIAAETRKTINPANIAAAGLETDVFSISSDTGTSSIDIDEVSAVMDMRAKNASPTSKPTAPIDSNSGGKTTNAISGPAIILPSAANRLRPLCWATAIAGTISNPARKAILLSNKVTSAPTLGKFSSRLRYEP